MTLAQLRTLFYAYIGTPSSDPMYPTATVNALINAVAAKYRNEIYQANPDYLSTVAFLTPNALTPHLYAVPADFAGALEVRITDATGTKLDFMRLEELSLAWGRPAYGLMGVDQATTLQTSTAVLTTETIWMRYIQQLPDLVADGDNPTWLPTDFHDLLAREAAIDAYGLGDEAAPSPRFLAETEDRRALFYLRIGRRSVDGLLTR